MTDLPLPAVAARLFNRPLAVEAGRLQAIMGAIGARFGIAVGDVERNAAAAAADEGGAERTERQIGRIMVLPVLNGMVHRHGRLDADSGMMESYQRIGARLEKLVSDPAVSGIVLDIDSPGGEVDGLFALAERVRELAAAKPIYAVANESAYSAAYALASSATRVFVPATAGVGSIGVIAMHVDQSGFDEKVGLRYTAIAAGKHKADFSGHEPLADDARKRMQAEVDRVHGIFLAHVAAARPQAKLALVREASLHFGQDAVDVGLADRIGGIEEAVSEMTDEIVKSHADTLAADAAGKGKITLSAPDSRPDQQQQQVVDFDAARSQGEAAMAARVAEIAELCQLAGCPARLGDFISQKLTVQQVRTKLLDERAAASDAAHAGVDTRFSAATGVGDTKAFWEQALVAAFGQRALEVPGREYHQRGGR